MTLQGLMSLLNTYEPSAGSSSLCAFMAGVYLLAPILEPSDVDKLSTRFKEVTGFTLKFEEGFFNVRTAADSQEIRQPG